MVREYIIGKLFDLIMILETDPDRQIPWCRAAMDWSLMVFHDISENDHLPDK